MKGIDGIAAREESASGDTTDGVQPLGQAQFDYIRRTFSSIRTQLLNRGFVQPRAICVFCSDVYDKMNIIKLGRKEFPNAAIFTADCDDRFLPGHGRESLRNTIVLSHAPPVDLSSDVQIPPMRDDYQTILARTVQKLLGDPQGGGSLAPAQSVYEVGRTMMVPLNNAAAKELVSAQQYLRKHGFFILGAIAAAVVSVMLLHPGNSSSMPKRFAVPALILIVVVAIPVGFGESDKLEPSYFFEGVSMFLPITLEFVALVTAAFSLAVIWRNASRLKEAGGEMTKTAGALFEKNEYMRFDADGNPILAAGLFVVISLAFVWSIVEILPDSNYMVRGPFARNVDSIEVGLLTILLFLVVAVVLSAYRRVEGMVDGLEACCKSATIQNGKHSEAQIDALRGLALRTQRSSGEVVGIAYYPLVVILIHFFSQLPIFDAFGFPYHSVAIYLIIGLLLTVSTVSLWSKAKRVRQQLISIPGIVDKDDADEFLTRGSFSTLKESPLFHAILLPTGGLGAIGLIQELTGIM